MNIPRDLANVNATKALAANQRRAMDLKSEVESVSDSYKRTDNVGYDRDPRPGSVTLNGDGQSGLRGSCQFDPTSKKNEFLQSNEIFASGPRKQLSLRTDGDETVYQSSVSGYSEKLVVNDKTDEWNFSHSFLGLPLP